MSDPELNVKSTFDLCIEQASLAKSKAERAQRLNEKLDWERRASYWVRQAAKHRRQA